MNNSIQHGHRSNFAKKMVIIHWILKMFLQMNIVKPSVLFGLSENYIENLKQESKKGTEERLLSGWPPYKVGFGYQNIIDGKRRIVDRQDAEFPFLIEIFQMALKGGHSYFGILKTVNKRLKLSGLTPFRSKSSIEKILKNPFYYGYFKYNGTLHKDAYPAAITKKEYDLIQLNMRDPKKAVNWQRNKLLNGIIKCGHCGLSVSGDKKTKKNKNNDKVRQYVYYRCSHFKQKCPDPYMEENKLFEAFENAIDKIHIDDELFRRIKEYLLMAHKQRAEQYSTTKPVLQRRINELEQIRDKAYEDKLKGLIDETYFNKRYNEWTQDIADLEEELTSVKTKNEEILHRSVLTFELANQARNLYKKQIPEEKARFLKMLLSNSFLKDKTLKFEYKKPFNLLVGLSKNCPSRDIGNTLYRRHGLHFSP